MGNNTDEDLANLIQLGDVGSSLDAELIMDMIKNITVNSTIEREMECTLQQNQSQVRKTTTLCPNDLYHVWQQINSQLLLESA